MAVQRPNLLVIHTDQQNTDTLGCYGGTFVRTPNVDRLAAEGALFTQCFTPSAICTPSRGCFVTGRYPHCHGAYANDVPLNRDEVTFAEALRRQGWATGYAGKWHLDGPGYPGWLTPDRSMGFEDCRWMFNCGHYKKITEPPDQDRPQVHPYNVIGDEESYTTDWLTAKTVDFIRAHAREPFCYMVSIPDPHSPTWVRPPYDQLVDPDDVPLPATFHEEKLPAWAERMRQKHRKDSADIYVESRFREWVAHYYGEVALIDDAVGRLLAALAENGILDNTIVVFTSDHGEYLGRHGLINKNELYEPAYLVPLIVRWPAAIPAGSVVERLVSLVDFQPGILNLIGIGPCGREQGRDLAPLLRGETPAWTDEVFIHHCTHQRAGIFTPEWELGLVDDGENILFDRRHDPDQVENRYGDPELRELTAALIERVRVHHAAIGSPATSWLAAVGIS